MSGLNINFGDAENGEIKPTHLNQEDIQHRNHELLATPHLLSNNNDILADNENELVRQLRKEVQELTKTIEYLRNVIKVKDGTIGELNTRLLSLSAAAAPPDTRQSLDFFNETKTPTTPGFPKSGETHAEAEAADLPLQIPQRSNERRTISVSTVPETSMNTKNLTLDPVPPYSSSTRKTVNTTANAFSIAPVSNFEENRTSSSCHVPRFSISSLASSNYSTDQQDSENHDDNENENENDNDNDNDNDKDNSAINLTDNTYNTVGSKNSDTLTLDFQTQLHNGDMTLGSSPRRASPNRNTKHIFTFEDLAGGNSHGAAVAETEHDTTDGADADADVDIDFDFNTLHTPNEAVYKKFNQSTSTLISPPINSTTMEKPLPPSTPTPAPNNSANTPTSNYSTLSYSNSISATPGSKKSYNVPAVHNANGPMASSATASILTPSTTLQNWKSSANEHSPAVNPRHSLYSGNLPELISTTTSHKRVISSDDSEKFLLNSMDHCVIRIEALIDPQSLSSPMDSYSASANMANKRSNYKISFLVYTDENSTLTPIYRVKKSYLDLLKMDAAIRPMLPNLPRLPEFQFISSLNYRYWADSKKNIQEYINKLLMVLKNQIGSLDSSNLIWKQFSNYFEFKIEINVDPDNFENVDYSVLNLQNKICYLLYIRKNFANKTYDFIRLNFSNDSDELVMEFLLAKTSEVLMRDEIQLAYRNQEISIKKKKKLSSKTWVFYAESDYDASEVCGKLRNWIDFSSENRSVNFEKQEVNNDDNFSTTTRDTDEKSVTEDMHTNHTSSPSINTPWKLFKKSNKNITGSNLNIPSSPKVNKSSSTLSIPSTPRTSSIMSTPSSTANDVLNFKALPYESNKLISEKNHNRGPQSPNLQTPNEALFQPVDDKLKYFSSSLQYSYELCSNYKLYGISVPSIVYQCITFLYKQSAEGVEGIFRLNGMMSEVNRIQEVFNTEYDCDLSSLSPVPEVHSIATLLKRYLRQLNTKLINDEITSELCSVINSHHRDDELSLSPVDSVLSDSSLKLPSTLLNASGVREFRSIFMNKLPQLNRNVLYVLFKYLRDVLKMGRHNKMSVSAMSVLMGPNLTESDGGGNICVVLLENFTQIFI